MVKRFENLVLGINNKIMRGKNKGIISFEGEVETTLIGKEAETIIIRGIITTTMTIRPTLATMVATSTNAMLTMLIMPIMPMLPHHL